MTVPAACTDSPGSEPTSNPTQATAEPTTSPDESPTGSPSPTSDTDIAAAGAEAVLREYLTLSNDLRTDTSRPLDELEEVATGLELDSQSKFLTDWREKGWQATGEARLVELDLVDVSLDNSDPDAGKVPTVTMEACVDVTGSDVVDSDGDSVIEPSRADRTWTRYLVSNYRWDDDPSDSWRVASSETLERESCDAA
ncbi:hypothetical protein [Isoptericola sp. NPDC019482]|uniref:hypothetical protein n=1 Tax=Isoptericola sp. NPDC019482 TaxID=3154688 RepID=UPI003475BD0B